MAETTNIVAWLLEAARDRDGLFYCDAFAEQARAAAAQLTRQAAELAKLRKAASLILLQLKSDDYEYIEPDAIAELAAALAPYVPEGAEQCNAKP